jgi:GAF domain-containing protein
LEAFRSQQLVRVDDLTTDGRWPEFAAAALDRGVRSSLSSPLIVAGEGIGALNVYASGPGHFGEHDEDNASLFAAQAAVALANAQAYWDQASLAENLAKAMESRAVIEQAKGVIMATTGTGADQAFDLLRQQSQAENRKLRELAAEIVDRQQR